MLGTHWSLGLGLWWCVARQVCLDKDKTPAVVMCVVGCYDAMLKDVDPEVREPGMRLSHIIVTIIITIIVITIIVYVLLCHTYTYYLVPHSLAWVITL
jgi:hypothetical protein